MAYTITGVPSLTTASQIGYDWFAGNDNYTFNIRVSVANTTTGTTLVGSTVVAPGEGVGATSTQTGLSPSTSYTLVMTIRRASNFEELGTRTVVITTAAAPPPPAPVWSTNFPTGTAGQSYSGSASFSPGNLLFLDEVPSWASSSPGIGYTNTTSFSISGTPPSAGTYYGTAFAYNGESMTPLSFSVTVNPAPPPTGTVPNVIGQTQSNAVSSIQNAGFSSSVSTTTSGATVGNNGTVASQSPGGGTTANLGSTVTITVYNYVAPTGTVPNVLGQTLSSATTSIQNAGFSVSSSTTTVGATSGNNGTVASQSPSGGTTATLGTTVSITTYNYIPPTASVPNVVGQTQAAATTSLQNAGFVVSIATTSVGANSSNNGTVSSQSPSGGSTANLGSTVTITVFTFNPPVWTDNVIVNSFAVGTVYSDSVSATNSPSYTITAGALPPGITLNSVSGAITGTPTTAGVYSFTITATNSDGSVSVSYNGTTTAVPAWTDQTLADFAQGRTYSDSVVATNSPTYSVTAGTLPVGTSLNSATGAITGTPTGTGAYNFTITATNIYGSVTATFTGTIKLPPNWIDNQLGSFITGVEYSDSVSASNSPTYSVSSGTLPAGTSLNSSTGVVSGTPTGSVGTSYSFTITATNSDGSISQAFSGSIQPDLGGNLKLYADGAWSDKEVYVYDGTTWVRGTVYLYNGTAWSKSVF